MIGYTAKSIILDVGRALESLHNLFHSFPANLFATTLEEKSEQG